MSEETVVQEFELRGGALCLDLANTVSDRPRATREHLASYDDLLRWGLQAEILGPEERADLGDQAMAHGRRARAVFARALELRETIYRIFSALARGERPEEEDIRTLNAELGRALPHRQVRGRTPPLEWTWGGNDRALDRVLWPVAQSAADLLTSTEAGAVRECASETCSWLFVDRSRTRRRKWCDMAVCGNRAKARRHYRRRQRERRSARRTP